MLAISPSASVLKPTSLPSSVCMNVLTAPISRAMGSISSSSGMMASLCGTVTLEPMKPGYARAASTNDARFSGRTSKGQCTASSPISPNAAFHIAGLREYFDGDSPIEPESSARSATSAGSGLSR